MNRSFRHSGTITVAAGNTPRKRRLRHPREQARYIARRLRGQATNGRTLPPVASFSVCEMGTGLRDRLRDMDDVRVVAPRANALVTLGGRIRNRIGNGVIVQFGLVEDVWRIHFPRFRDRFVRRGLTWPVATIGHDEGRYNHCSAHVPTKRRATEKTRAGMIHRAARKLERADLPAVLSGDFNGSQEWVRDILGPGWHLAERADVIMIWVRGFDVVGAEVDVTVKGTLTDHSGFVLSRLRVAG